MSPTLARIYQIICKNPLVAAHWKKSLRRPWLSLFEKECSVWFVSFLNKDLRSFQFCNFMFHHKLQVEKHFFPSMSVSRLLTVSVSSENHCMALRLVIPAAGTFTVHWKQRAIECGFSNTLQIKSCAWKNHISNVIARLLITRCSFNIW